MWPRSVSGILYAPHPAGASHCLTAQTCRRLAVSGLREGATTGHKRPETAQKMAAGALCGQHLPGPTRLA